ncbi:MULTISPECIES: 30S ribosomal protein S1 [Deinococcus]|jgi:small subunit ribosomal protein S1|uniref:Small ribosomal subunit protein bS1 n=3 Tax=Deinococcus TaxID=1298 RepID=A0A0F7JSW9_9DEIO|nr:MULTISPECIES: 30S ribosomal protein S1 [Deinococcus]AKH17730.1 30S ribosomal protein S1 [Deinococcus soli (ex Cha et al. 2016)]MDK2014075.1 30S ribosomal protein S1 [Deinococcus sp. 43]MDR6220389.1 small subunit ribosomal protein S1 [Deinococcus soli (ex Cha et al. 2016)]MDR6330280.1 small subunit ribosomal protein S1 [Deinococcus soli (ex Cha et al. 2016)]MDR6753832.1 small subunit ribosomal protein S1 [Deinococcus soli (ex Cha et al. 2016)]
MEDNTQTPAQQGGTQPTTGTTPSTPTPVEEREYPAMTMEDILASEAQEPQNVSRGDIVDGTIVFIGQEGIAVDIGAKVEGIIPLNQLGDEPVTLEQAQEMYKSGEQIEAYVVRVDLPNSQIVLSKKRADQDKGWRVLEKMQEAEEAFEVEVLEKVRGGLVAQVEGIRAFLPASQVDTRRVNDLDPYVGKPLMVKLIELNRKRNRVIISHRAILEAQKAQAREATVGQLEAGAQFEGEVVEITDFGVFVNLGGIDGLVHRSELTYGRFNHPRDVVKVGDKVQVQVMDVDNDRERINLSMKALTQDPWEGATDRYSIGQKVTGKVTNLTNFGAFVELESGLEGLVHVSEMSWTKRVRHPNEVMKEGDEVEAVILRIDPKDRRISLGIRQTTDDPWSALPDRYPPGTPVKGKITGMTDFGVFMEIEEGIEGLIHISELDLNRVNNPADLFKKGDEIEAVILNIDPVEQRASLSRRRFLGGGAAPTQRDYVSQGGGARSDRYSGGQGGQRGGGRRREGGADYAYNAKDAQQGGKISTKLGDVYADLFAQFGLGGDKKTEEEQG